MAPRQTTIALAVLTAALLAGSVAHAAGSNARLGRVASELAARAVTIECRPLDVLGIAYYSEGRAVLAADACRALSGTVVDPPYPRASTGAAILALAHEAAHLRGLAREEKAEEFAWRNVRRTAFRLGYDEAQVPAIVAQAREATFAADG